MTRRNFLLRWVLANVLGWGAGLFAGAVVLGVGLLLALLAGGVLLLLALPLAGGLVGALAAYGQQRILNDAEEDVDGRYIAVSSAGGALGIFPALLFSSAGGGMWLVGFGLAGAALGAAVGGAQWRAWFTGSALPAPPVGWRGWLLAHTAGGALCAVITMSGGQVFSGGLLLPACCGVGLLLFALLTGAALLRQPDAVPDEQPDDEPLSSPAADERPLA